MYNKELNIIFNQFQFGSDTGSAFSATSRRLQYLQHPFCRSWMLLYLCGAITVTQLRTHPCSLVVALLTHSFLLEESQVRNSENEKKEVLPTGI